MSVTGSIERVIQSPDKDSANDVATYCVGCGSCAYLDPALHIVKNTDGCYQAVIQGKVSDANKLVGAYPFASSVNEDEIGADLFSRQTGVHHDAYLGLCFSDRSEQNLYCLAA